MSRTFFGGIEKAGQELLDMLNGRRAAVAEQRRINAAEAAPPAPESIERLLREGVRPRQIMKIKGCSIEEVQAEAVRIGLESPRDNGVHHPYSREGAKDGGWLDLG